jgi:hypothetical protein
MGNERNRDRLVEAAISVVLDVLVHYCPNRVLRNVAVGVRAMKNAFDDCPFVRPTKHVIVPIVD